MTDSLNGAAAAAAAPVAAQATQRIALVDRKRHAGKRVRPITDWAFAREANAVPLTGVEFGEAAREMPIGFVHVGKDENDRPKIVPMALMGLRERENLLVSADGSWNGRFVPATLRRYPFAYVRTPSGGDQLSLVIDEACEGLNDSEGELLITAEGEPTDYLQQIMRFLDRYELEQQRTEVFCARLVELELLRGAEIKGDLPDGDKVNATGFFMVDEDKLNKLPDAEVLALHRTGMMALIHTHLVAMGQVQALAQRLESRKVAKT
ncbi:SapC family protein [Leptothrix discophora]|uniref:SapC family protein n=1 Tax=Leptothrix discophora TaxID=89 RepID=A0ABT9G1Z2_LEPDI|nr:SapC family protein [Leptothrix discophora]MDP4300505.1 SapC family protein [Leptothrix discophora]